jgi:formate dehydrogenase beta subunit
MLTTTLFLLGLGFVAALILAVASKVFYVWEDPKIAEVEDSLLGANCGGCGFPGCSAAATAVILGKTGVNVCVAGGNEVALKVAAIMGQEVELKEPEIAYSSCRYNLLEAETRFIYSGVNDCRAAAMYGGGPKECPIGCIGLGTCARACPFGAITMGAHGMPVFDRNKCRSCGICVEVCPKDIIYLSSATTRMIGDYRVDECSTPCQRACPSGVNIPAYIRQISMGNYDEALRIIKERCPLPLIVGRICPAPCEMDCRRTLVDQSVGINNLKRFVADREMQSGRRIYPFLAPKTDHRVAVIGGGAQGLSLAFYLACLGHKPTVFESSERLGGIIRYVIPESRLPEKVVDWEIEGVLGAGVEAETGKTAGRDFTIGSLLNDGYKAVAFATGGLDSRQIIHGRGGAAQSIPGVYTLLDFLTVLSRREDFRIGGKVYVFGGGNATLEAARLCLRKGAEEATIIYPFLKQDLVLRGIDVDAAEREGIRFLFGTVISGVSGTGDTLAGLALIKEDCSVEHVPAEALIAATGRISDLVFVRAGDEDPRSEAWATIASYAMNPDNRYDDIFNLNENGVFNDNLAVIHSIAKGRRMARAAHLFLTGKELEPQANQIKKDMKILNITHIKGVDANARNIALQNLSASSYCDTAVLFSQTEIGSGLSEDAAIKEAARCLDCGLICYKKSAS